MCKYGCFPEKFMSASSLPILDNSGDQEPGSDIEESNSVALPTDIAQAWLAWQCRMIAGVICGAIFVRAPTDQAELPIAFWPEEGKSATELNVIVREVFAEGHAVIHANQPYGQDDQHNCDLIGCPLQANGTTAGAVVLMISSRANPQQQAVLQLLQWGGMWIEKLVQQHAANQQEFGLFTINLTAAVLRQPLVRLAAMEAVNRLAELFACERVSLGLRQGLKIDLQALSHVRQFDQRTQMVRGIEAAMEEAVDQAVAIVEPAESSREAAVSRAHKELAKRQGYGTCCTVLLPGQSGCTGALTFERAASKPFDKAEVASCEMVAGLIGPILQMKQREERQILLKGGELLMGLVAEVFGSAHLKLKMFTVSVLLLLAVSFLADGEYRITATATIEGAVRQILAAPHQGYVKQADARAGDLVKQGQLIALLDDRSLQLEYKKWQSEINQVGKIYQKALANRDRTEVSVLRAKIAQIEAEMQLVEGKIERTRLVAPFDGVVVSGDFSQALGAPVEMGQILFEVASLDNYRVVLEVDDHNVAGLQAGMVGQLIIAALPQTTFAILVRQIVPVAISRNGRNYFRVEATLDESSVLLRPGMQGVAKIEMGQRKLFWIWTHSLVDRLRLWAWSVGL